LHGKYKSLIEQHKDTDFDLWLDTGDFFGNIGRAPRTGFQIIPEVERKFQSQEWLRKDLGRRFKNWLGDRPAVTIGGNHDFLSLHNALKRSHINAHAVTPEGIDVLGLRFAGFREVPYMVGEWEGETHDFHALLQQTMLTDMDVLATHAPPQGILDVSGYVQGDTHGIPSLVNLLCLQAPPRLSHHFFGHAHENGGITEKHMNIQFHNGAGFAMLHNL